MAVWRDRPSSVSRDTNPMSTSPWQGPVGAFCVRLIALAAILALGVAIFGN